ncbi:MAG: hypothetical protein MCS20_02360 [Candidatus Phytoplasma mali]|nr:hypothetical protein [Candidatus Phytoplasma australiense]MCG7202225.1 hypothetical protein [Candidatus Phytoplasma mali]
MQYETIRHKCLFVGTYIIKFLVDDLLYIYIYIYIYINKGENLVIPLDLMLYDNEMN